MKKIKIALLMPVVAFSIALTAVDKVQPKPNVIVILSDDLNYTELSCYGAKWGVQTPNIDNLAKEGVRFTNAYCSAPTCGPSRAGLLTGRYQTRFGHEFNSPRKEGIGLPLTEQTIGDRMKEQGYKTAIIGKWHMGGDESCGFEYHPQKRGFDYFYGFYGSMIHFYRSSHLFRGDEQVKEPRYLTDVLAEESCQFIESNQKKPFFLYLAFNAVHTPLEADESDLKKVRSLPYFKQFNLEKIRDGENVDEYIEKAELRAAMLISLDRAVGTVLEKLKTLGIDKNTMIVFTNDNGDYYGNGIYSEGKGSTMEGGIKVPMIIKWPGKIKPNQVFHENVISLDILPTSIAAAGGNIYKNWNLDGVNLLPYINKNITGSPHDYLFWRMGGTKAARCGKWKIQYNGKGGYLGIGLPQDKATWRLFDLEADPSEKYDLSVVFPEQFEIMKLNFDSWEQEQIEPLWKFGVSGQMGQW